MGGSLLQNGWFSIAKWVVLYCTPQRNPLYINTLQRCFFFILFIPFIKRINRGCIADATPYFIFIFLSLNGLKIGLFCPLRYEHKGNTSTPQETRKK